MTPRNAGDEQLGEILGTFIGLVYDADIDEFTDGTKQRYDNAKAAIQAWSAQQVREALEEVLTTYDHRYQEISKQVGVVQATPYTLFHEIVGEQLAKQQAITDSGTVATSKLTKGE